MDFVKELDETMSKIKYGWADTRGYTYPDLTGDFAKDYCLQTPDELLKSQYGVCWDQVELERKILTDAKIKTSAYNIIHYSEDINPKMRTHTFLLFDYGNKVYWYEHAWEKHAGTHQFNSTDDAITAIKKIFVKDELGNKCDDDYIVIYEYSTPKPHLTPSEFYEHCESSPKYLLNSQQ